VRQISSAKFRCHRLSKSVSGLIPRISVKLIVHRPWEMSMSVFRNWLIALTVFCGILPTQDVPSITITVKSDVQKMNEAMITGNYADLVDLTHPAVVKIMGGRERMIAGIKREFDSYGEKGFGFNAVKVGDPGEQAVSESQTFIVVPFELEMKVPDGIAFLPSFVIGVSEDKGKTWSYINGDLDIRKIKTILPNLPDTLKIPAKKMPRIVRE
jgi:hypothetical protein